MRRLLILGVIYLAKHESDKIAIKSNYDNDLITFCRSVQGNWNSDMKRWILPMTAEIVNNLVEKFNAVLSPEIVDELFYQLPEQFAEGIREKAISIIPDILNQNESFLGLFKDFGKRLRPFQIEGIVHLSVLGGRAILGDEMGLGKTIQALGFWHLHDFASGGGKTLIICPKNVKFNWAKEIEDCTKKILDEKNLQMQHIVQITGQKPYVLPEAYFYLINYDIVNSWLEQLQALDFRLMILDEAHYIKNSHSKRTKATIVLGEKIKHVLALTGTPILNRVSELWPILHMLKPSIFSSKKEFMGNFTYIDKNINQSEINSLPDELFTGGKNLEALAQTMRKHILVRRTKKEVLKDLPPKTRIIQYAELDEKTRQNYKQAENEFIEELNKYGLTISDFLNQRSLGSKQANILALLEKARQEALNGKMPAVYEWIDNFLESYNEEKLVVFIHHRNEHKNICSKYKDICVGIKGGDSDKERQEAVEKFQNDKNIRLIIISITAGAEGINLTAASNTLIIETAWSPGKTEQAEDRIHRIGQKANSVTIWHMVAADTIDEPIYLLLDKKNKIIDEALSQNQRDEG
jgi:SNF2 family DNA or RNA helicase